MTNIDESVVLNTGLTSAPDLQTVLTTVSVQGDVSGQLAVGSNIVQVRVDTLNGNLVTLLPPGAAPRVSARARPVWQLPARPHPMFGRNAETREALSALADGRTVQVYAAAGTGKSTLLRHLAYHPRTGEIGDGVVHLAARGVSRDDLLHRLFDACYTADLPIKPTAGQLRQYLQPVRAALLLDDAELSADELGELEDIAPGCRVVVTGQAAPVPSLRRSIALAGLPPDDARSLLGYALGRPLQLDEEPVADWLCGYAAGSPAALLQLAAAATQHVGSLRALADAVYRSGPPAVRPETATDAVLIGLLAAVPELTLDARQLAAICARPDVPERLRRLSECGLVRPDGLGERYRLADGIRLDPSIDWQLDSRRAELSRHFAVRGPARPSEGDAEALSALQDDAGRRGDWRHVLTFGLLLDAAYALSGRWDAWYDVLLANLAAARALGDEPAVGQALHQLGTRALCLGHTAAAAGLLSDALGLRTQLGDRLGAQVTRHNLQLIIAPPAGDQDQNQDQNQDQGGAGGDRSGGPAGPPQLPLAAKALAALLVPLVALGTYFGLGGPAPDVQLSERALAFGALPVSLASEPRSITLNNTGAEPVQLGEPRVIGSDPDAFMIIESSCAGALPAGQGCATSIVFAPVRAGNPTAELRFAVAGLADEPTVALSGSSPGTETSTLAVAPLSVAFGEQPMNTSSTRHTMRLTAPAASAVQLGAGTVLGAAAADFVLDSDGCSGAALPPGGSCTAAVRFTPGAGGERDALLTITVPGQPTAAIPLNGSGAMDPTRPRLEPTSLDFGVHAVGTPAAAQAVTLHNTGTAVLPVAGVSISGGPEFTLADNGCPPELDAGARCTVTVGFTPQGPGRRVAQLRFDAAANLAVPLRGGGAAAVPTGPLLSPSAVAFGTQPVGSVAPTRTLTMTNRAAGPVRVITAVGGAAASEFRVDSGGCAGIVPAGGSCRISVGFAPTAVGLRSAAVLLSGPGLPGPVAVPLSGIGVDPRIPLVPDVIGLSPADAGRRLAAVNLVPGRITRAAHPDIASGLVSDQTPRPGSPLIARGAVDLTVSVGPGTVRVPPVIGLPQPEAERALTDVRLRVGAVSRRPDASVAVGQVLDSKPGPGTPVAPDSPVKLVVSSGPDTVRVPPVVGEPLETAKGLLAAADLVTGSITGVTDPNATPGTVTGSTPAVGADVARRSAVNLTVAAAPASDPTMPDVVGQEEKAAREQLAAIKRTAGPAVSEPDSELAPGLIRRTDPVAGTPLKPNTAITLFVSSGPKQIPVPDVTGHQENQAIAELSVGFKPSRIGQESGAAAAGTVLRTEPAAGKLADPGSPVGMIISTGPVQPETVVVPDVSSQLPAAATLQLRKVNLTASTGTSEPSTTIEEGAVIRTEPAAGRRVEPGSEVILVLSSGPPVILKVKVEVPKVVGDDEATAVARLDKAGLKAGPITSKSDPAPSGSVIASSPVAGTSVDPGTTVELVISSGQLSVRQGQQQQGQQQQGQQQQGQQQQGQQQQGQQQQGQQQQQQEQEQEQEQQQEQEQDQQEQDQKTTE